MASKSCNFPLTIKNKFISSFIGTLGLYIGISFLLPLGQFSVYITSYINLKQNFVTMYYGLFLSLILNFSMSLSTSLGGLFENKLGFYLTTLLGTTIVLICNIFFFNIQNIWICYILTLIIGIGLGICTSLLAKNLSLYFPGKKGLINGINALFTIGVTALFSLLGEKLINTNGETFEDNQEVYSPYTAKRTYLYFMLGFSTIPVGDIIFVLFSHVYEKSNKEEKA